MYKNYNFNDDNYFCNIGGSEIGLYKVEFSDNKKFNIMLTKIGNSSKKRNLYDIDDQYTLEENIYDKIIG